MSVRKSASGPLLLRTTPSCSSGGVTGRERGRFGAGADTFCSVSFSADGGLLLVSGYDRQLRLYDVADKTQRLALRPPNTANGAAQLSPDGRLVLATMGEHFSLAETATGQTLLVRYPDRVELRDGDTVRSAPLARFADVLRRAVVGPRPFRPAQSRFGGDADAVWG